MGAACVSFSRSPQASPAAEPSQRAAAATVKVVNLDGSMARLAVAGTVVTAREALAAGDGSGRRHRTLPPPLFLCSADELGFDAPPRALAADEALHPGQLYLVLPDSALRRPLTAKDMAALAVKAATALAAEAGLAAGGLSPGRDRRGGTPAGKRPRRQSAARVAPLLVAVSKESSPPPPGDGAARKNDVHRGYDAARPAGQDGGRAAGKTRKGASYRARGSRHRAVVQRLSAIAEDGE
uniref:TMV response-related protein n=1 Tax=Zea mays TaxID=4577 RepID=B6SUL7_MAIZE|nr:TMV response-related protein [Zea mays]